MKKKINYSFIGIMAAMLLLQLLVLLYFGNRKAGFHEDEMYTYYSSNKTAGLFVNDRQWMERDQLRNDFVVLPGEGFRYTVVKQMQSWDVHPPLYYYIFHTACSLFPGAFSKWLGIGVNMIAYVFSYLLLAYAAYTAATQKGKSREKSQSSAARDAADTEREKRRGEALSFLTCLSWGFSSAVISGVMFIRMYQWLTFFILLCLMLHLRAVKTQDFRIRTFLLPLAITVFFGFLTQYYYIIFHFFLGLGFCLFLLRSRKIKEMFAYAAACAAGLLGAVCYYPSSLSHIFRGYRGTEAVSEFGDVSNTWGRLRFFYGLFDDYVMNGTLSWWLLAICLLAVTTGYLRKKGKIQIDFWSPSIGLILFASVGYFFTISKTALLLGETSNRYQLPIYGLLLFLILYSAWTLLSELTAPVARGIGQQKIYWIMTAAFALLLALTNFFSVRNDKVFFLYEEEKEIMEFVQSHKDGTVVVLYNEASPDNIWRLSDELMQYEKTYLASQADTTQVTDQTITTSPTLLVYAADHENQEEALENLLKSNKNFNSYRTIANKGLWTLYLFE